MKIQWLSVETEIESEKGIKYSSFGSPESLDSFEINVFDLSDERFWISGDYPYKRATLRLDDELELLNKMVKNSSKTKILVLLPQDISMKHGNERTLLKNMLSTFESHLRKIINLPFSNIEFEPTETTVVGKKLNADFYFLNGRNNLTKSNFSEKATTTVNDTGRFFFSSIDLSKESDIEPFLIEIGILKTTNEEEPEWMEGIDVFDDKEQSEAIAISLEKIKEQQKLINKSNEILKQNKRYKSILYTQGDELVEVVFDMVEEMLDVDLSEFVDERKEDIGFKIDDEYFIGEIKGIADNVKAGRLSQLDNHTMVT